MGTRNLVVIALVGGAVSGAAVSAGLSSWLSRGSRDPAAVSPDPNPTLKAETGKPAKPSRFRRTARKLDDELTGIERRIASLEERASSEEQAPIEEEEPLADVSAAQSSREWFDRTLQEHEAEPIDPEWSTATASELAADLRRVHEYSGVEISEVSCRNTTCTAVAQWPDRATAARNYALLLHLPFRVNCERSIVLPDPEEGETAVAASLHLNCESWRAEGSPMIPEEAIADLRLPTRAAAAPAELGQ